MVRIGCRCSFFIWRSDYDIIGRRRKHWPPDRLSAASLIGIQFWYADHGGEYVLCICRSWFWWCFVQSRIAFAAQNPIADVAPRGRAPIRRLGWRTEFKPSDPAAKV